jgi:iron complex outermembrane receptor protein
VAVEVGARGRVGAVLGYSAAVYAGSIRDAIVQAREVDGRAFFENAGRVRTRGAEVGLDLAPVPWLRASAAYAFSALTFAEYRVPNGAVTDTLDGKRLAGVPRHALRATLAISRGPVMVEAEQQTESGVFGDDRNTLAVAGWGAGVTGLRASAAFVRRGFTLEPFIQAANLFGRRYVGSVNLNGAGGRVLEPAPGRAVYLGATLGWAAR